MIQCDRDEIKPIIGFNPIIQGTYDTPEGVFARGGDVTKQRKFGIKYKINLETGIKKCLKYLQNTT